MILLAGMAIERMMKFFEVGEYAQQSNFARTVDRILLHEQTIE